MAMRLYGWPTSRCPLRRICMPRRRQPRFMITPRALPWNCDGIESHSECRLGCLHRIRLCGFYVARLSIGPPKLPRISAHDIRASRDKFSLRGSMDIEAEEPVRKEGAPGMQPIIALVGSAMTVQQRDKRPGGRLDPETTEMQSKNALRLSPNSK
jgi:hypothetical protein